MVEQRIAVILNRDRNAVGLGGGAEMRARLFQASRGDGLLAGAEGGIGIEGCAGHAWRRGEGAAQFSAGAKTKGPEGPFAQNKLVPKDQKVWV